MKERLRVCAFHSPQTVVYFLLVDDFFWAKTPLGLGMHCSIIAINVLYKVARFHQHCQTKVISGQKAMYLCMVFENLPKNISKLIVDGM